MKVEWDNKLGLSTIMQAILLLGLIIAAWTGLNATRELQRQNATTLRELSRQTTRIERYLSGKDPNYWKTVHDQELKEHENDPR